MASRLFSWKLNSIHYILLNEGITIYLNLHISILYSKYRSFNSNIESGKWIPFHRKGRSVVTAPVSTEHHEISQDHPSMEPWHGMWNPQIIRWLLVPEPDKTCVVSTAVAFQSQSVIVKVHLYISVHIYVAFTTNVYILIVYLIIMFIWVVLYMGS